MKIIALEEHFVTPQIMSAWNRLALTSRDISIAESQSGDKERLLYDLLDERIMFMTNSGINMQVLSQGTPGVQNIRRNEAIRLARITNDLLSETVNKNSDRFQAFAVLPTSSPNEAANELERAVCKLGLSGAMIYGRTGNQNLDDRQLIPIFEAAAALRAPIYLHPQTPLQSVRKAYYNGFSNQVDNLLASAGIGWHYESGIQVLRLILSGIFDWLPDLQLILGHWGEMVLFFLDRIDLVSSAAKLKRPVSSYFNTNISVTPSGIFSQRYLRWALEVVGPERIMFSTDYPYQIKSNNESLSFLENAEISVEERNKIAYENWERMSSYIKK